MSNSKNRVFNPYFKFGTCPMRKTLLRIIRELNPTILSIEKYHFLRNFALSIFMDNSSVVCVLIVVVPSGCGSLFIGIVLRVLSRFAIILLMMTKLVSFNYSICVLLARAACVLVCLFHMNYDIS